MPLHDQLARATVKCVRRRQGSKAATTRRQTSPPYWLLAPTFSSSLTRACTALRSWSCDGPDAAATACGGARARQCSRRIKAMQPGASYKGRAPPLYAQYARLL